MFHVKIKLKESPIHRIGLFTDQTIFKGEKIYTANPKLDLVLSQEEFTKLPEDERKTIKHYGYLDKNDKKWHLSFEDIRFCNNNIKGNLTLKGNSTVAKRDIKKGEELTQNYEEIEELENNKKRLN